MAGYLSERGQTETLAVTGPYRLVRNPIYLAGITLLAGIGLLYGPWRVADLVMPVALFVYFHLAVIRVEEPALRRRFGASYSAYCQRVSRWLPRLAPGAGAANKAMQPTALCTAAEPLPTSRGRSHMSREGTIGL